MREHFGNAERAGDLLLGNQLSIFHVHTELFGEELGVLQWRVAAENHEFFTTPTHKGIGCTDAATDKLRKVHEHFIANAVAPSVVDLLEEVNVEHDEREGASAVVQTFLFPSQNARETGAVQATCKGVFLRSFFVVGLFDFKDDQVVFQFFATLSLRVALNAVITQAKNQVEKEGEEPESDKNEHQLFGRNEFPLKCDAHDFESAVTERRGGSRLDFN